jgi:hypothetical protein
MHMVLTSRNWFVMQGPVAIILISWNVIFTRETGYWTRAIKRFALFDLKKKFIFRYQDFVEIYSVSADDNKRCIFIKWKCVKIRKSTKMSKILFLSMCDVSVFDIYYTEFGTALTTILPILFQYCYKYCYSHSRNESGRFGALKSDSTHHFFRNACTKSRSLRFSQFSGCWLILPVYILMSFDFPFVKLFGIR